MSIERHSRARQIELGQSIASRRKIYLDARFWIILRDAALGVRTDPVARKLLHHLRRGVAAGRLVCPVSASMFLELMKQAYSPGRRIGTAELIGELSLGVSMIPSRIVMGTEIHSFLLKANGDIDLYLPLYFPEIERFAGNSRSDWFLALLERFPTPGSMTAIGQEAFTREAWSLVGRKVSKARLINDIYETACASIALPVDEDSVSIAMFRMVIAQARSLIRQRDEIEQAAHAVLSENRDYQLLRMIPGIGPINALTILAEAGDLRRFAHHRQFLKFCGLDLATCQSGTFRGRTKLSKYGNARLRRTFWMAAQVAAGQRDNNFRDKLGRYIEGHANDPDRRRKAMTALTAKMARVTHAVIKTGTEYRPFLERADTRWKDPSLLCREGAIATL